MSKYKNLVPLIRAAQDGNEDALSSLLNIFNPLLVKHSVVKNTFDPDLYQELQIHFVKVVQSFDIDYFTNSSHSLCNSNS